MGIPVIKDLPVGNNLMDHLGFGGLTFTLEKPVSILQNKLPAATATTEYVINERGKNLDINFSIIFAKIFCLYSSRIV